MFLDYKIVNNVLYLYVDDKCEIGSFYSHGKVSLIEKVKHYIKDKKIKFDGTKVVLILSGLMLGTIYLNSNISKNDYDVYKNNKYVYNIVDTSINSIDKKVDEEIKNSLETIDINNTIDDTSINNKDNNESNKTNLDYKNNSALKTEVKNSNNNNNNANTNTTNESVKNDANEGIIQTSPSYSGILVTVNRSNGEVLTIGLEDYLVGVVSAEMPASFNDEALKAQAVIARTYTRKLINSGRIITDNVSTQVYKSDAELKNMWNANYEKYYNKVKNAVLSTKSKCVTYNGELIDAVYHSTSNGYTQDAVFVWGNSVPYLKTVTSPWDTSASTFIRNTDISFNELSSKLGFDFNQNTIIQIISKDESGRVSKVKVGDKEFTGVELRNVIGLRSADFDVTRNSSSITFTTRGYGHGVGMSQYGANGMANSGYTYEQILKYYYSGVEITNIS